MIIPTAEFDPFYADDGVPFRDKMLARIERDFADLLCRRGGLLKSERGLEVLTEMVANQVAWLARRRAAA